MTKTSDEIITVIEPTRGIDAFRFSELWRFRELLYFLVWRDVKIRYKQTALGALWAILQPLLTAIVFTLIFGKIAGIPSDGVPYAVFSYTGLVMWTFFAQGLSLSSNSLVNSSHIISKVYFPRQLLPMASIVAGILDFLVALSVLMTLLAYYGIRPGPRLLAVPFLVLLAVLAALGAGLWLSALNVAYRDVRFLIPFLIQSWLFLSPVIYPVSQVAPRLEKFGIPSWVLGLNPMTGVVEGFRWAVLCLPTHPGPQILAGSVVTAVLVVSGGVYFRRKERFFADVV